MKWFTVFIFILNNLLLSNFTYAQNQNQDEQEKARFKQEAQNIYSSVNISRIVPYEAFLKAYIAYFKYKNKLSNRPLITFVNWSIPSNQPRLVTVDFNNKSTPFISIVAHGMNSRAPANCDRNADSPWPHLPGRVCHSVAGATAESFSDTGGSFKSEVGFLMFGEYNRMSSNADSLRVHGLESKNAGAFSRTILLHGAAYPEQGLSSAGCFVVPNNLLPKAVELLRDNTLVFAFEGSKMSGNNEEEIPKSIIVESKEKNFAPVADVSNIPSQTAEFKDLEIAKAPPSNAGKAMGLVSSTGAVTEPLPSEPLKGSPKFEECQKHSDTTWEKTVEDINKGKNPSLHFRGSWNELHQTMIKNSVENGPAMEMANERAAVINDCVATAHISDRTDFKKENINQPEKKSSKDGSINCVYEGPESQDYQTCLDSITAHDALLKEEFNAHEKQKSDYKTSSQKRVNQVSGENAQSISLAESSGLMADHSNIATERANISANKIDQLFAVASKIPTKDMLYDECSTKFAKHGTVSVDEYNQFAKMYSGEPKSFSAERDYCMNAVTNNVKPIHNEAVHDEVKKVLKTYGREMNEYTSKSGALINRTSLTPNMNNSSLGLALRDIDLKLRQGPALNSSSFKGYNTNGLMLNYQGSTNNNSAIDLSSYGRSGANAFRGQYNNQAGIQLSKDKSMAPSEGVGNFGGVTGRGSNSNGIYNDEFYRRINLALQSPQNLASLKLSQSEMREYLSIKSYNELMAKGASGANGGLDRAPASGVVDFKQMDVSVSSKELNLFDIISNIYAKKVQNGL